MKLTISGFFSSGLYHGNTEMFVRWEAEKSFGYLIVSLHLKAAEQFFFTKGLMFKGRQAVSSKGLGDSNSLFGRQVQALFRIDPDSFRELRI